MVCTLLKWLQKGYCPKVSFCFRWTCPPASQYPFENIPRPYGKHSLDVCSPLKRGRLARHTAYKHRCNQTAPATQVHWTSLILFKGVPRSEGVCQPETKRHLQSIMYPLYQSGTRIGDRNWKSVLQSANWHWYLRYHVFSPRQSSSKLGFGRLVYRKRWKNV